MGSENSLKNQIIELYSDALDTYDIQEKTGARLEYIY